MHIACLPHGSDTAMLSRVMAGVTSVGALVLPPATLLHDQGKWHLQAIRELRRTLFLDPELQILAAVAPTATKRVTRHAAGLLAEAHCASATIGRVLAEVTTTTIVEWLASGEALLHAESGEELDEDAVLESASIQLGAAPLVEASESGANLVIASKVGPGSLVLAAAFESLSLDVHDWNQLATVLTIARIVEKPGEAGPLWMEIDDTGNTLLVALPTLDQQVLDQQLDHQQQALHQGNVSPDVQVDLSTAHWHATTPGRYQLMGVTGSPPTGRYAVELVYRPSEAEPPCTWPTTIGKTLIDWDASVRPASKWMGKPKK